LGGVVRREEGERQEGSVDRGKIGKEGE